jgi:hypothetical protein
MLLDDEIAELVRGAIAQTSDKANGSTAQAPVAQTSHKDSAGAQCSNLAQGERVDSASTTTQIRNLWDAAPMKDHIPPTAP